MLRPVFSAVNRSRDGRHLRDVRDEEAAAEKSGQQASEPIVRLWSAILDQDCTERREERALTGTHVSDMVERRQHAAY
jgi:hypothetical protein